MPNYLMGDIFKEALHNHYDLAIVFGHIGLNVLGSCWLNARDAVPEWKDLQNPFDVAAIMTVTARTPLWRFVDEGMERGMSDERLKQCLDLLIEQARNHPAKISTIIMNGIRDEHRGHSEEAGRASDDRRALLLGELMAEYEKAGLRVTLISSNDAFTRNFPAT